MKVLGMILAGGKGERLFPLTKHRAKPSVPFGGKYRIIDFVLSNFVNSHIYSIYVLTQFKSQSLTQHIQEGWQFGSILPEHFITPVPAQMRLGDEWYRGTADAIFQNLYLIEMNNPSFVAVFGADHIYRMDIQQMIRLHEKKGAGVTVAAIPMPLAEASQFGIIQVDDDWRVVGFQEKPKNPAHIPGQPDMALVSMGNYLFSTDYLMEKLEKDNINPNSSHDFGKDIMPAASAEGKLYAYNFAMNVIPGSNPTESIYWRDLGTIQAYFDANMDLKNIHPNFNLHNNHWPILNAQRPTPPAKFVFDEEGRRGTAINSIVCEGCVIQGAKLQDSILGRDVKVHSDSYVINSILLDNVVIGEGCKINMAIIDKNVKIEPHTVIGYDAEEDRKRYHVDEKSRVIIIPKVMR